MKSKDPNYAIKVEKAIAEKYGTDTVQHPRKDWDNEKEKKNVKGEQGDNGGARDRFIYTYWRRLSPHSRGDGRKAARAAFQSPTGNPCPSITEGRTLGVTPLNDTSV